MAQITFSILDVDVLNVSDGSGLGFYGAGGFGSSVALDAYQDRTYLTNSLGNDPGPAARNIKYTSPMSGTMQAVGTPTGLLKMNGSESTLVINFSHDTAVKVQNAQLRIFDRNNINNPASGVNTKVAEIINFNGSGQVSDWLANAGDDVSNVIGSGDALWWGSPWPSSYMYVTTARPYYQNSVGVKFYNFTDLELINGTGNRDSRLAGIVGGESTVGGTGIIVPLVDSPGSGGQGLIDTTYFMPKFTQYVNELSQTTNFGMSSSYNGTGVGITGTYGGSGADTLHTWRVALSASPYTIGSKEFGLYISLEYLA